MSFRAHNQLLERKVNLVFSGTKELLNSKLIPYSLEHRSRSAELHLLRKRCHSLIEECNRRELSVPEEHFSSLEKEFSELKNQIERDQNKQLLAYKNMAKAQVSSYMSKV